MNDAHQVVIKSNHSQGLKNEERTADSIILTSRQPESMLKLISKMVIKTALLISLTKLMSKYPKTLLLIAVLTICPLIVQSQCPAASFPKVIGLSTTSDIRFYTMDLKGSTMVGAGNAVLSGTSYSLVICFSGAGFGYTWGSRVSMTSA
jgi:hypothetical protein